jgi:uncharacterized BrkB/YihY/UPF0761 family membrane protein
MTQRQLFLLIAAGIGLWGLILAVGASQNFRFLQDGPAPPLAWRAARFAIVTGSVGLFLAWWAWLLSRRRRRLERDAARPGPAEDRAD